MTARHAGPTIDVATASIYQPHLFPYYLNKECTMPRFPIAEPDVAALAALVADGLEQAAEDFPTPPVPATELRAKLDTYTRTRVCPCKLGIHSQSDGYELDLVLDWVTERWAVEIKLTSNPTSAMVDRLNQTADMIDATRRVLVCRVARKIETERLLVASLPVWLKTLVT